MARVTASWEDWEAEGDTEHEAIEYLIERVTMDVREGAEIEELDVYEVETSRGTVGVLASHRGEAEDLAQKELRDKLSQAREGSDLNQAARDLFNDYPIKAQVQGKANRNTYEIDNEGRWNEGEL